jgi:UDP-N-acetylmuramate dehydrogenase
MWKHTTFQVGGPADLYFRPETVDEVTQIVHAAREENIPLFVLGGGANILVSDRGIRGIVLDTAAFASVRFEAQADGSMLFRAGAGMAVSDASAEAAGQNLSGMAFIYAMPGSVGGAVWMNARCYGASISDILVHVDYIDEAGSFHHYIPQAEDFAYKISPFQGRRTVILEAAFRLLPGSAELLWKEMREVEADRRKKGHFAAPCAGSVFKNNREFGAPSGRIIDGLGLRGFSIGGAKVSDLHANIVVNTGSATAADIKAVMDHLQQSVLRERGFLLDPEVLLVGEWDAKD